jgi:sec-independent protein translocase protein TatC
MADATATPEHPDTPQPPAPDDGARMPFMEHLRELRDRIRNSVLALVVGFIAAYAFSVDLLHLLELPLAEALANHPELDLPEGLSVLSMMEVLWTRLSIAFWAGIFIASPVIFYQIWLFIGPGLYQHEQKVAIPFAFFSFVLFTGGALFCYFFVLPTVCDFLIVYSTEEAGVISSSALPIKLNLTLNEYYAFAKRLLIGFGFVFELPLLIFFLSIVGMVTHRSLWKFNRYAVVLSFILAAILTPPDPISQVAMAGPLVILYNISILIAFVVTKRREAKQAEL